MSARGGKKKTTKLSRSSRAGVIFPVGRMMRYLRRGTHKYRIGMGAPVYMAAVIEYLAGNYYFHDVNTQPRLWAHKSDDLLTPRKLLILPEFLILGKWASKNVCCST